MSLLIYRKYGRIKDMIGNYRYRRSLYDRYYCQWVEEAPEGNHYNYCEIWAEPNSCLCYMHGKMAREQAEQELDEAA